MQKTGAVTTWGGIMAAVGGAVALSPLAVLQAYATIVKDGPPHWYIVTILPTIIFGIVVGGVGKVLGGWASAGQDETAAITPIDPNKGGK